MLTDKDIFRLTVNFVSSNIAYHRSPHPCYGGFYISLSLVDLDGL
nr:MAG TPA: hypothetical protein [Caudoviricetes sp.]